MEGFFNEMLDHLNACSGLVHRDHMTGVFYNIKKEIFEGFQISVWKMLVLFLLEFHLIRPAKIIYQILASFPVADVVLVPVVYENRKSTNQ